MPSETTLLGLVKHAAFVERGWFDVALAGRSRAELGLPDTAEESFMLTLDDTVDSVSELSRSWLLTADGLVSSARHGRSGGRTCRTAVGVPTSAAVQARDGVAQLFGRGPR